MDHGANVPLESHRLELDGEYDLTRRDELTFLFAAIPDNAPAVIDLSRVSYVDSTFLHVLASLHFRLKAHGVTLTGANASIRRLLSIVKFDQLFSIADA